MNSYPMVSKHIEFTKVADSENHLLKLNDRVFYVGKLLHLIISELMQASPISTIAASINNKKYFSKPITIDELQTIIATKIVPLNLGGERHNAATDAGDAIQLKMVLFKFSTIRPLLNYTKYMFQSYVFSIGLTLSSLATLIFFHLNNNQNSEIVRSPSSIVFYTISFAVILLIHELGHASAAYYHQVAPKEIGVGVYIFFPVFYADVTNVWSLSPRHRIVVNLAGVYSQLIVNFILIIVVYKINAPQLTKLLTQLIYMNSFSILANLNPFLKLDGYWIYSDLFDLPNLRAQSYAYLRRIMNAFRRKQYSDANVSLALQVYTVSYILFMIFALSALCYVIPVFIQQLAVFITSSMRASSFAYSNAYELCKYILGLFLVTHFLNQIFRTVIRLYKKINNQ